MTVKATMHAEVRVVRDGVSLTNPMHSVQQDLSKLQPKIMTRAKPEETLVEAHTDSPC